MCANIYKYKMHVLYLYKADTQELTLLKEYVLCIFYVKNLHLCCTSAGIEVLLKGIKQVLVHSGVHCDFDMTAQHQQPSILETCKA